MAVNMLKHFHLQMKLVQESNFQKYNFHFAAWNSITFLYILFNVCPFQDILKVMVSPV